MRRIRRPSVSQPRTDPGTAKQDGNSRNPPQVDLRLGAGDPLILSRVVLVSAVPTCGSPLTRRVLTDVFESTIGAICISEIMPGLRGASLRSRNLRPSGKGPPRSQLAWPDSAGSDLVAKRAAPPHAARCGSDELHAQGVAPDAGWPLDNSIFCIGRSLLHAANPGAARPRPGQDRDGRTCWDDCFRCLEPPQSPATKAPRLGRWQEILADALDHNLAIGVCAAVGDHLGRASTRAELTALRDELPTGAPYKMAQSAPRQ
jgi:hypothetical protein